MSLNKFLILLVLGFSFLSCSKVKNSATEYLTVKVTPNSPYLLPSKVMQCSSTTELEPPTLTFEELTFKWTGDTTFKIVSVLVQIKNSNLKSGSYECALGSSELAAVMPTRDFTKDQTKKSSCSFRCGKVEMKSTVKSALMAGKIKVIGVETDNDGNQFPVVGEYDVTVNYSAF